MRNRAGHTLIELIVTIVVVGLTLPFFMDAFAQMALRSATPDLETVALALAREKLEILAADKHAPSRGYAHLTSANYPAESPVTGFLMDRSVSFTDVSSADLSTAQSGSGFRKAVVTVSWQGGAARVTLGTAFTNH